MKQGEVGECRGFKGVGAAVSRGEATWARWLKEREGLADEARRVSHPVLEGKPNVNHVRDRISNSRTQQLHNWTSSHSAQK